MHRGAWLALGLPLALGACMAPPPEEAPQAASPGRAAELACIRRGRAAEVSQPWLGATNPRAAVIGARVRNDCLDAYRRSGIVPGS